MLGAMTNTQILGELSRLSIILRGEMQQGGSNLTMLSGVTDPLWLISPFLFSMMGWILS